jgi:hypothetical protein
MLHSHTSSVFRLGLTEEFCKEHMPFSNEKFIQEDGKEKEWECTHLAHKQGLSGGWRGFALKSIAFLVLPRRRYSGGEDGHDVSPACDDSHEFDLLLN